MSALRLTVVVLLCLAAQVAVAQEASSGEQATPEPIALESDTPVDGPPSTRESLRLASERSAAGDLDAAIEILTQAREREPSPRLDVNLAIALATRGRIARAAGLLQTVVRSGANPLVVEEAREHLRRLQPRLSSLRLRVDPVPDGAAYFVDGSRRGPADESEHLVNVEEGAHVVTLQGSGGLVLARTEVEVERGQSVVVSLHPVPRVARRAAARRVERSPVREAEHEARPSTHRVDVFAVEPSDERASPRDDTVWHWVIAGAGAATAVVVVSLVIALAAASPTPTVGDTAPIFVGGEW